MKYRQQTTLAKAVDDTLPEYAKLFGTKVFDTKIRESIDARKAQAAQSGLFEFAPYCTTARDYENFIKELLKEEK